VDAFVPCVRKARAWDRFKANYHELSRELQDDVQGAFGAEFAQAYQAQTSGTRAGGRNAAGRRTPFHRRDPAASGGDSHVD
jgi:hypothetical protein